MRLLGPRLRLVGALVLLVASHGCSWSASFVVLNYAAHDIWVEYSIEPHATYDGSLACQLAPPFRRTPDVMPARRVKKDLPVKAMQPAQEYTLDENTCSMRVHLEGDQGVLIWRLGAYDGIRRTGLRFPDRIVLTTPNGLLEHEGDWLADAFHRRSRYLYVLSYGNRKS